MYSFIAWLVTAATPLPPPLKDTELHVLGWSAKGDRLAVAQFHESDVVSHQCVLRLSISSLVDDKQLWSETYNWGDPSDGSPDTCPRDAKRAWLRHADATLAVLAKHSIEWAAESTLSEFPLRRGDESLSLRMDNVGNGEQSLVIVSTTLGEKVVAKGLGATCAQLEPRGYLKSPSGDRIAIIIEGTDDLPFCPEYLIVGSTIKTGFKHPQGKRAPR